jgi:hypothetical protein
MGRRRVVLVGLAAAMALSGCANLGHGTDASAGTPSHSPSVARTPDSSTPTEQVLASLVDCTRTDSPALLVDDWSLVEHPRGRSDRERMLDRKEMLDHFRVDLHVWLNGLGPECPGVDQLAQLNGEAARLDGLLGTNSATDAEYARIRAAGDAWLDAVGYTDHRFGDDILADN